MSPCVTKFLETPSESLYVKNTFFTVVAPQLYQLQSSSSSPALMSLVTSEKESASDQDSSCGSTCDDDKQKPQEAELTDDVQLSDRQKIDSDMMKLHRLGQCKPCAYIMKADGCRHGSTCKFCHFHDIEETSWWFKRGKKQMKLQKAIAR
mmetsp:Transcript_27696/g.50024  ORF Transcript_27696/g.50024 Transcript_27696/m.50024 type:complete len:150 (+) Transcript_27696:129-578(+)